MSMRMCRPESKKPVENVVWPEGKAPGGTYKAYVHHYKKHKKRRSKDPTYFHGIICNAGGDMQEYEGLKSLQWRPNYAYHASSQLKDPEG